MTRAIAYTLAGASLAACCALAGPARAQAPASAPAQAGAPAEQPNTQQIIDALKGRTRSMRNLGVAEVTPPAGSAAAPARPAAAAATASANAASTASIASGAAHTAAATSAATPAATANAARPSARFTEPEWPPKPASIDLALQFEFNSNRVTVDSMKTLLALAQALASPDLAGMRFLVQGHTDATGLASYNVKLSQARAEQVKRILVQNKVDARRLTAEGKGSSEPADPAHPDAPENRRVRIVSLGH